MTSGMLRTVAVDRLARARGDMLSVVTMQAVHPWIVNGQLDCRNINVTGSMGSAGAIALGLALAQPGERVLVLDGDGSLLMQLGSLVSIASQLPRNLYHVVLENGTYETSGGQDVPGRGVSDLCEIARASGYAHVERYGSVSEMDQLPQLFQTPGPVFLSLLIAGPGRSAAVGRAAACVRRADRRDASRVPGVEPVRPA